MKQFSTAAGTVSWQAEQRLHSRDRVWIVTDTFRYTSSMFGCSPEQQWFRVGAFDLRTNNLGYYEFSVDDARAMLVAGVSPPPWREPLPVGIQIKRLAHDGEERGRYRVTMTTVQLPEQLLSLGGRMRAKFESCGFSPNGTPGMWEELVARVAREKRIEDIALAMSGAFSAGDVKRIVGAEVNVTPVLRRLVDEGRLIMSGKKRGTRYELTPPFIPARVDWAG